MQPRLLLLAAGSLLTLACVQAAAGDDEGSGAAAQTVDAGAPDADADAATVDIAPFSIGEVADEPKIRFAVDDGAPVDAIETTVVDPSFTGLTTAFQGYTPIQGGLPAVNVQLGRARAPLAKGTYACEAGEAVAVLVREDGNRMTFVKNGPSRACTVVVDDVVDQVLPSRLPDGKTAVAQKVVGHFEATVGARDDAASPTNVLRGAFATKVIVVK